MSAAAALHPPAPAPTGPEQAFVASCRDEIEALKPGNVHVHAAGHGMTVDQFLQSAEVSAPPLCARGAPVGARILGATRASVARVGLNTNLGIVLLCAPLAAAAETAAPAARGDAAASLRAALKTVLRALDLADAEAAYEAIRLASPGGLGAAARHDAREPATTTLIEAMREAQGRDMIARQYAQDFAELFGAGLPALRAAREQGARAPWLASVVHMEFLGRFDDSHVARKFGPDVARGLREQAAPLRERFSASRNPVEFNAELLAFDADLKSRGLNPGTTADLTVATLFADRLIDLIARDNND
ncbi:triphosphoribosyl-dephospho-CoA synthase [Methylocella sp.]|uniref:triphosphoribosyl-dephospho-CoA synthase n=1 Tax=Methylocella sp. TaxID=1978226 RepID=UPI00378506D9